ncbi:ArsR/SmtB family transcription factor [Pueribacillus sp. YX66]|uniref:ArsR/SmtB family transcription factor n=1 Tax=Pueribacillus sp. YX66 TaxID=3229242 RepID=UPI0036D2D108
MKALSDENRFRIMAYLSLDTLCVCEIVELLTISQPQVSQHLRKLREAGLVKDDKRRSASITL